MDGQAERQARRITVRIVNQRRSNLPRQRDIPRNAQQGTVRPNPLGNGPALAQPEGVVTHDYARSRRRRALDRAGKRITHPFIGQEPGAGP